LKAGVSASAAGAGLTPGLGWGLLLLLLLVLVRVLRLLMLLACWGAVVLLEALLLAKSLLVTDLPSFPALLLLLEVVLRLRRRAKTGCVFCPAVLPPCSAAAAGRACCSAMTACKAKNSCGLLPL
jgi:hypothetical protein